MFLWLLRLFPEYCSLRGQVEELRESSGSWELEATNLRSANTELITEKRVLESELDSAREDKERLWDLMKESLDAERMALRTQVNHATQKLGGGIPYPDAHAMPAAAVPQAQAGGAIGRRGRVLMSQVARERSINFIQHEFLQRAAVTEQQDS